MPNRFGSDYTKRHLNLNDLLPSVNRSETSESILSTVFERWITKPNLTNVSGTIGARQILDSGVESSTPIRQAYQLHPIFYSERGSDKHLFDWNDILRKISHTGVDPTRYKEWGTTTHYDFNPPIDADKFANYLNYFWVNALDTIESPDYVTITASAQPNDWSIANKWKHKRDLGSQFAYARQAQQPIIEFADIELSRWYKVVRKWKVRNAAGQFIDTTLTPNLTGSTNWLDWELQSEELVPVEDQLLVVPPPADRVSYTVNTDVDNFTTITLSTPFLRGQNDVRIFKTKVSPDTLEIELDQTQQIVDFVEVEQSSPPYESNKITVPGTYGVDDLIIIVGTHHSADVGNITRRIVRLAPNFTTFTPNPDVNAAYVPGQQQMRDLSTYKLIGQRKLTKYQLPIFNLFDVVDPTIVSNGHIVQYTTDSTKAVNYYTNLRIDDTTADFSFTTDLVNDKNELLSYKLNTGQHHVIWRNQSTYTPNYVDGQRNPVPTTQPGGWEPSKLLTANPLRETRPQFKFSEVIKHFQAISSGNPGTIQISSDGGTHLISSLIADNLSVPILAQFIANELHEFRTKFEQQVKKQLMENTTLRTTPIAQLSNVVYQILRTAALAEGGANSVYDDTLSYDRATDTGYPGFPLTFGVLGLTPVQHPTSETDRKLSHAALKTHEGTRFFLNIPQQVLASIEEQLGLSVVTSLSRPNPTTNFCIWKNPQTNTRRFECSYFSSAPPINPTINFTWYNPGNLSASKWNGNTWVGIAVDTLWYTFDVPHIILSTFVLQELDVISAITQRGLSIISPQVYTPEEETLKNSEFLRDYNKFKHEYTNQDTATQVSSRLFRSNAPTDPFTWNYGHLPLTQIEWDEAVRPLPWATSCPNTVYEMYTDLYNTPLPHVQPWAIQGHHVQPFWWNAVYADPTGARRWRSIMWENIKQGITPAGYPLPDGTTLGTGSPSQLPPVPTIAVNTTNLPEAGYNPDDLLPPIVDTTTFPNLTPNALHVDRVAAGIISTPADITTYRREFYKNDTSYDVGNYLRNIWDTNPNTLARNLITIYRITPLSTITTLLQRNLVEHGTPQYNYGLPLHSRVKNVIAHTNPLHSRDKYVDTSFFSTLVFFARRKNFSKHDNSPLFAWNSWTTRLGYQTGSLIVPATLRIYQECNTLEEFSVILKKSENVRQIPFSNIIITLHQAGSPLTLPSGRGDDWIFKVNSSENVPTLRRKYAALQQAVRWNAASTTFTPQLASTKLKWITGEEVQIISYNFPAGYDLPIQGYDLVWSTISNELISWDSTTSKWISNHPDITENNFFTSVTNLHTTLHSTIADAVTGQNPVQFGSQPTHTALRSRKATFTAASKDWEIVELDRNSIETFDFSEDILLTGIQSLIDFIVGYTEFMQDDGVVINAGENTILDTETNEVVSWQQQLTKAINRIYSSNGLSIRSYDVPAPTITTDEFNNPALIDSTGKAIYTPRLFDRLYISKPFAEINPFRNTIFFRTPNGLLCDLNNTPYVNELTSHAAIFDDAGFAITTPEIVPLRTDRLTTVLFRDTQPPRQLSPSQDLARRIGTGSVSLDFYEHVILLDQQTSNGLTIFDRFFNLQKSQLNLEFQKSVDFNFRPVMGGFSVTQTDTIPNFEMVSEYQRNDYNVADSNELIQSTSDTRSMLGKTPSVYFKNAPVTSKTEFQFWQQLIREKGTKGALTNFARHRLFEDIQYDEFWAWKLGTFGSIEHRQQIELQLTTVETSKSVATLHFGDDTTTPVVSSYPVSIIHPTDQSRWKNFPTYLDTVGLTGFTIQDQTTNTVKYMLRGPLPIEPQLISDLVSRNYLIHNLHGDYVTGTMKYFKQAVINSDVILTQQNVEVYIFPKHADIATNVYYYVFAGAQLIDADVDGGVVRLRASLPTNTSLTLLTVEGELFQRTIAFTQAQDVINSHVLTTSSVTEQIPPDSILAIVELQGVLPSYETVSPLRVIDMVTNSVYKTLPAWDPENGIHTPAVADFDYIQAADPASYNNTMIQPTESKWVNKQLGVFWLDSSTIQYKPYNDPSITSDFDTQTRQWGELADECTPKAYQWVESMTAPSARSTDNPYTRDVLITRSYSARLGWNANNPTFTSTDLPFVNEDRVVLYKTASATSTLDKYIGIEYVINGTAASFTMSTLSGEQLTLPTSSATAGVELFVAAATWATPISIELVDPLQTTFYACEHTDSITNILTPTYDLPDAWLTIQDVTAPAHVLVNGITTGYRVNYVPGNTATITILDNAGNPRAMAIYDVVSVRFAGSHLNAGGFPPQASNQTSCVVTEFPHTELRESINGRTHVRYYYWAANPSLSNNPNKTHSLQTTLTNLLYPATGNFFAIRNKSTTTPYNRHTISVWGLFGTHQVQTKVLAIDIDKTLRDRYVSPTISKTTNEQWALFRQLQDRLPHADIWNSVTTTLVGYRTQGTTTVVVPTPDRVAYDYLYNTNLSYGTSASQTLIPTARAREMFDAFFSISNPQIDSADYILLTDPTWVSNNIQKDYKALCEFAYTKFPATLLNTFIFDVIKEGLYSGYEYSGIFKTSYIALLTSQKVITDR